MSDLEPEINEIPQTPEIPEHKSLLRALEQRNIDDAWSMLDYHLVDINESDINGNTPLLLALDRGYYDIAVQLIEMEADIHATNRAGTNALLASLYRQYLDLATYFIENRVNVNQIDESNNSPILIATIHDNDEICDLLLTYGADMTPHIIDDETQIIPHQLDIEEELEEEASRHYSKKIFAGLFGFLILAILLFVFM